MWYIHQWNICWFSILAELEEEMWNAKDNWCIYVNKIKRKSIYLKTQIKMDFIAKLEIIVRLCLKDQTKYMDFIAKLEIIVKMLKEAVFAVIIQY